MPQGANLGASKSRSQFRHYHEGKVDLKKKEGKELLLLVLVHEISPLNLSFISQWLVNP